MNLEKLLYLFKSVFIKMTEIFNELVWTLKSYLYRLTVVISPLFSSSNVGLFLSIIGSIVIAKAVITTNPQVMSTAHGRLGGYSSIAYFYASRAKKEAVVGVIYLVAGFVFQITGFPRIQLKTLLIISILAILFFVASFKVLRLLSARDTLRAFIKHIKYKNTYIRSIAEDFKSVGIRNDIVDDILKVQSKHKDPSQENFAEMIRSEEWELVKKIASRWHIKIDPNNVMERQ